MLYNSYIVQRNYMISSFDSQVLELAKNANSINEICLILGNNIEKRKLIKKILIKYNFDLSKFKKQNNSILNDIEKLKKVVSESFTYSEVLNKFNLSIAGGNMKTLKYYLLDFNISVEHFNPYKSNVSNFKKNKIAFNEIFCITSKISRKMVKRIILENNLIPYMCSCGVGSKWNKKILTLQLEHKNGDSADNRLENLEFLCPNCHSQTLTYGSKNIRLRSNTEEVYKYKSLVEKIIYKNKIILEEKILQNKYFNYGDILKDFNIKVSTGNLNNLKKCLAKLLTSEDFKRLEDTIRFHVNLKRKNRTKISFPPPDIVLEMVKESSYVAVAKSLNCSDNGVKKYLKRHGLI